MAGDRAIDPVKNLTKSRHTRQQVPWEHPPDTPHDLAINLGPAYQLSGLLEEPHFSDQFGGG